MSEIQEDAAEARMRELADVADACSDALVAASQQTQWLPTRASRTRETAHEVNKLDPAEGEDGIRAGFGLVTEVVLTYLEVAGGHLRGLAALLRAREAMYSPQPLVRAVMENSAHAMWVMGDPTTGTTADLLARAYLEEFYSCEVAREAAVRMGSEQDDAYVHADQRWQEVRRRAIAAFPGTTKEQLGGKPRTLGTQKLIGPEASVVWMFDLMERLGGGSVNEHAAKGIYAFLSAGTHPSLFQARQLRQPEPGSDDVILLLDVGFLERLTGAGVVAFYTAFTYALAFYFGSPEGLHEALADKIGQALPGYLT